jgi:hypothetical protein
VPNHKHKRSLTGRRGRDLGIAAAQEATIAREHATHSQGEPETETLTEKGKRPQITLKNGAVVDARQAVAMVQQLQTALELYPDEFRSLLAMAEGRPGDADPRHFEALWARAFLENDHSIDPMLRDVLLNCYEVTREGPVVVPLRLQDAADLSAAKRAQREYDQQFRDMLRGRDDDEGPSRN